MAKLANLILPEQLTDSAQALSVECKYFFSHQMRKKIQDNISFAFLTPQNKDAT